MQVILYPCYLPAMAITAKMLEGLLQALGIVQLLDVESRSITFPEAYL
jgi:hypothetical protein